MVTSSTRIEPVDMTGEHNIKYFKGNHLDVLPEEGERRREKSRQARGISKQRTADGATKSIFIIMGYYLVSSLFLFILPNFEASLPAGHEARIIIIRSVHLLNSTNSILNFVVFSIASKHFRREILKLFRCRR